MPEYLAPGVFVEEVSYRSKSIAGVGTSVAGLVGPTRTGPLRGRPELLTSFADFQRIYGDARDLELDGSPVLNHTAIAAKAFFDNGGTKLYLSRVVGGVNGAAPDHSGTSAGSASAVDGSGHVSFQSRFPGRQGNYTLELLWRDRANLLALEPYTEEPEDGELLFLEATGLPNAVRSGGNSGALVTNSRFPLAFRGLVRRDGDHLVIVDNLCEITDKDDASVAGTDLRVDRSASSDGDEGVLMMAGLAPDAETAIQYTRVRLKTPSSGALEGSVAAVLSFTEETDLSAFTGGSHWGAATSVYGSVDSENGEFTASAALNAGVGSDLTFSLTALAAASGRVQSLKVQRDFDLEVRTGGADGEVVYSYGNLSTAPSGSRSLATVMSEFPARRNEALSSPVACELADTVDSDQILAALYDLFDEGALTPEPTSVAGERYLIPLEGGTDGDTPGSVDYGGELDEVNGGTGFAAFEDVEDIAIAMAPAAAASGATNHQAIVAELQKHCRKMRYRVGIVDSREAMALSEVRAFRNNFDDSRLALYYPWIVIADPTGERETITVPPAGFMAGVYARTDVERGVHKTPANEPVIGALGFAQEINRFQQEVLNPEGINCLRSFPGRGHRVWGGRTLSSDPEWQYLSVRRYFLARLKNPPSGLCSSPMVSGSGAR